MLESIAVVGLGCRFPRGIEDTSALWSLLAAGEDVITAAPPERPMPLAGPLRNAGAPTRGGYLSEVGRFDAAFFGISPREARSLDPQHRVFLQTAWHAVEAANLPAAALQGRRVGLYAALGGDDYLRWFCRQGTNDGIDQHFATGNAQSTALGRLAHMLGLRGPAIAVDTACSSSAVAVHLACRALQCGDIDAALAGGVNLVLDPGPTIALDRAGMLAPDGRCKVFDSSADGYVRGEGCGVLVLKRLSDAMRDADPVRAVIRGSALNHDGRAASLTTPKGPSQEEVIREALRHAGLTAADIDYVEAHGTGTSLGDAVEMAALHATYGVGRDGSCWVGSVKANLGHCEAAAGVAGILKAILCLEQGMAPPQPNLVTLNPHFASLTGAIEVPRENLAWPEARVRRGAVSSFGFSGTNAHIILEAAPEASPAAAPSRTPVLLVSAKSEQALRANLQRHLEVVAASPHARLQGLAQASAFGRTHWRYRAAIAGGSRDAIAGGLRRALEGPIRPAPGSRPTVAFVFGGQGEQHPGMAQWSYENDPAFRATFDRCAEVVRNATGLELSEIIYGDGKEELATSAHAIQFAIFGVQVAQAAAWRARGITPDAVTGHSLGEYAAAVVAGACDLDAAVRLICARADAMSALPDDSGMAVAFAEVAIVDAALQGETMVGVAAYNGPAQLSLSGDAEGLERVAGRLRGQGVKVLALPRVRAFHSPLVERLRPGFEASVGEIRGMTPQIPWFSTATGDWVEAGPDASFWSQHMRAPVRFVEAVAALRSAGAKVILEIGPTPVLTGLIRHQRPQSDDVVLVASGDRRRADDVVFAEGIATLHGQGLEVDWTAHYGGSARTEILPGYAFDAPEYWLELSSAAERPPAPPPPPAQPASVAETLSTSPLQDYYATLVERHAPEEDAEGAFIRFAPFCEVEPGFSWLRVHASPDRYPAHFAKAKQAREEMWRRAFAGLKLSSFTAIGDVGCGFGADVLRLAETCPGATVTGFNISQDQVAFARRRAERLGLANARFDVSDVAARPIPAGHDLMLGFQVFHHVRDKTAALRHAAAGLAPGGYMVVAEILSAVAEPVVDEHSTAFFSTVEDWAGELATNGLRVQHVDDLSAEIANYLYDPDFETTLMEVAGDEDEVVKAHLRGPHQLGELLRRQVTRYLLIHAVKDAHAAPDQLLEDNRSRLSGTAARPSRATPALERSAAPAAALIDALATATGISSGELHPEFELAALGLDSLMALEIRSAMETLFGARLSMADLLESETVGGLTGRLLAAVETSAPDAQEDEPSAENVADALAPFPLTDIQQAYWIGRRQGLELGGVAAHFYAEFERADWDIDRLEAAWNKVVARHPMLRAVVVDAQSQVVLPSVPTYSFPRHDLQDSTAADQRGVIAHIRDRLSHEVKDLREWPPFTIEAARLRNGAVRLFFSIDILFVDATSALRIGADWRRYYEEPEAELPALSLTFRDCVVAASADSEARTSAMTYWRERAATLPAGPALPYSASAKAAPARFVRRAGGLSASDWERLKKTAQRHRLTPSVVLLTAYATVLERWSAEPEFTIATTLYNRHHAAREIYDVVGDFTSINLTEVRLQPLEGFAANASRVRRQLAGDLDHGGMSGVEVLRELNRLKTQAERGATFPVVFTSALSERHSGERLESATWMSDLVFGITQTPQVLLDHSAYVVDGGLRFHWDAIEERFSPGVLQAMFDSYQHLLKTLAAAASWDDAIVIDLPADEAARRAEMNATSIEIPSMRLEQAFLATASRTPDALAVAGVDGTRTYRELEGAARQVERALTATLGCTSQPVGVLTPKSCDQAAAVLGILLAGRAYVPLDPEWPIERLRAAVAAADLAGVVVLPDQVAFVEALGIPFVDVAAEAAPEAAPRPGQASASDAAYVIFTSGSTGEPKGVVVSHDAAWNTIVDINDRFGVTASDRLLGLSSLGFDLSVYDLFGALAAGAAVILPTPGERRDPRHWSALIQAHGVTVWNSAPALMELFLESLDGAGPDHSSVRLVLLSGDWVPLSIGEAIRRKISPARVVALGGATEAAIWSTLHEVEGIDPAWTSVPYGRAMRNQEVDVVDRHLRPKPEWAVGEIIIRGRGLALGYCDPEQTAARFVTDLRLGERCYRTGDLGRVMPAGHIEFLGRTDGQVKLRGHRIELGEIEASAHRHPGVRWAVAAMRQDPANSPRLVLYVVADDEAALAGLPEHLRMFLPGYMCPTHVERLEEPPLTANGKIDRRGLPEPRWLVGQPTAVEGKAWERFASIWASLLGAAPAGADDDFLQRGGDSLSLTRLLLQVRQVFGVELPIEAVFSSPTAGAILGLIAAGRETMDQAGPLAWFPLSSAQKALWDRMGPVAPPSRCLVSALRPPPGLGPDELKRSLDELCARHEALRLAFGPEGQALRTHSALAFEQIDASAQDGAGPPDLLELGRRDGLDAREAVARVSLVQGAGDRILVFLGHPIALDVWSLKLMAGDLQRSWRGEPISAAREEISDTPALADYLAAYEDWLASGLREDQIAFWTGRLDPTGAMGALGDRWSSSGAVDAPAEISALLRDPESSLTSLLITAIQRAFRSSAGVALATSNRLTDSAELLAGPLGNVVVVASPPKPLSWRDQLALTRETLTAALDNRDTPIGLLAPGGDPATLCETGLILIEPYPIDAVSESGEGGEVLPACELIAPLTFVARADTEALRLWAVFDPEHIGAAKASAALAELRRQLRLAARTSSLAPEQARAVP
jgi:pyochelin synthetase